MVLPFMILCANNRYVAKLNRYNWATNLAERETRSKPRQAKRQNSVKVPGRSGLTTTATQITPLVGKEQHK